jgi:hypothetical protein
MGKYVISALNPRFLEYVLHRTAWPQCRAPGIADAQAAAPRSMAVRDDKTHGQILTSLLILQKISTKSQRIDFIVVAQVYPKLWQKRTRPFLAISLDFFQLFLTNFCHQSSTIEHPCLRVGQIVFAAAAAAAGSQHLLHIVTCPPESEMASGVGALPSKLPSEH